MILEALRFIKDQLNYYLLKEIPDLTPADFTSGLVVLGNIVSTDGDESSDLYFPPNDKVVISLIHLEEERVHKAQRPYTQTPDGKVIRIEPELKYNLYVLIAPRYVLYEKILQIMDLTLDYFQSHNVFDASEYPGMPARLKRIIMDIHTVNLEKSFEFWQSLNGKFQPAVMFKLRLVAYSTNQAKELSSPIMGINTSAQKL